MTHEQHRQPGRPPFAKILLDALEVGVRLVAGRPAYPLEFFLDASATRIGRLRSEATELTCAPAMVTVGGVLQQLANHLAARLGAREAFTFDECRDRMLIREQEIDVPPVCS